MRRWESGRRVRPGEGRLARGDRKRDMTHDVGLLSLGPLVPWSLGAARRGRALARRSRRHEAGDGPPVAATIDAEIGAVEGQQFCPREEFGEDEQ